MLVAKAPVANGAGEHLVPVGCLTVVPAPHAAAARRRSVISPRLPGIVRIVGGGRHISSASARRCRRCRRRGVMESKKGRAASGGEVGVESKRMM